MIIQEIIQRDLDWARAHLELDLDLIEEIMSDEYQQRQADGTFHNKAVVLASYHSGQRKWEIAESTGHHVQLSGDLAIVIGLWRGKGFNHGQVFDYSARFLSIYRSENQVWKMILDQSIPVVESAS